MDSRHTGFTIIELMITVALIAVLATIAAPSMRDLIKNARMTALVNDFMNDLNVARAESVKRGMRTAICPSTNGTSCTGGNWNRGWIIFAENANPTSNQYGHVDSNEVVLKIAPQIDGATEVPPTVINSINAPSGPDGTYVGFRPSGVITPGGIGANIDFHMCDSRSLATASAGAASSRGRRITVTGTGRASATRCTCQADGVTCN